MTSRRVYSKQATLKIVLATVRSGGIALHIYDGRYKVEQEQKVRVLFYPLLILFLTRGRSLGSICYTLSSLAEIGLHFHPFIASLGLR